METEATHVPTKTYESSTFTWQGSIKAAHTCGMEIQKLCSYSTKLFVDSFGQDNCTFSYEFFGTTHHSLSA